MASRSFLAAAACKDLPFGGLNKGKIIFEDQSFVQQIEDCYIDSLPCAAIEAFYPLAIEGPEEVCQKINETLLTHLRLSLALFAVPAEQIPQDLGAIAKDFFDEYELMKASYSNYIIPWKVSTKGKVLFQSPKVVSIQLDNYGFAGGAHPLTQTTILNFDSSTGEILEINDLILNQQELETIVEAAFKEVHEIEPGSPVNRSEFASPLQL